MNRDAVLPPAFLTPFLVSWFFWLLFGALLQPSAKGGIEKNLRVRLFLQSAQTLFDVTALKSVQKGFSKLLFDIFERFYSGRTFAFEPCDLVKVVPYLNWPNHIAF